MSAVSINISEKCLRNQKFCVHLLLRTDTNIVSQKHNNADNKALPFVHFYYGSRVGSQNLTGQRLFCCHILKLLTDKCEPKLKALRRIIVPLLHLYPNYRTFSISQIGRSQNLFAKFKTLRTFVSANVIYKVHVVYLYRSIAGFLRSYFVRHVCQNTRGLRSFCTHTLTNFCTSQWQTWTRVVFQRKALILLYSLYNRLNLSLISRTGRSQNLFAELNPFRIFVMRQNRIARFTKYIKAFGRISVALLLRVVAVLSQELGVRPLFMQLTDLCSTKCDRTTQAVRRIIVPLLHLYPNYRTSSISQTGRSQSVYNHSLWTILKSSPRCFVYLCMSF